MLPVKIQTLLAALPRDLEAAGARHDFKRVALALSAEPRQATAVVGIIGKFENISDNDERLIALLSSTLDEARMAGEN